MLLLCSIALPCSASASHFSALTGGSIQGATVVDRIRTGAVVWSTSKVSHLPTPSKFRLFFPLFCPDRPFVFNISCFFFSGECNGRNLNFAMPLLRGKDESDAAVAAVGSCHHSSARLRAEADGAAPWLHGGGSQRDDPGPGSSRVRLPLPVHLLPIPAASGYKCVRLWPSSSERAVHSSWSSLPFPC